MTVLESVVHRHSPKVTSQSTSSSTGRGLTGLHYLTDSSSEVYCVRFDAFTRFMCGFDFYSVSSLVSSVALCRFSPDDQFLAAACGDGVIRVYSTATG
jgi:WD40 repeat protein